MFVRYCVAVLICTPSSPLYRKSASNFFYGCFQRKNTSGCARKNFGRAKIIEGKRKKTLVQPVLNYSHDRKNSLAHLTHWKIEFRFLIRGLQPELCIRVPRIRLVRRTYVGRKNYFRLTIIFLPTLYNLHHRLLLYVFSSMVIPRT